MSLQCGAGGTVYVVGGYLPQGGAYMAYHLGHILNRHFGLPCTMVSVAGERSESDTWEYPARYPVITLEQLGQSITENDLLIANPSFSNHLFGLRLPGRKLMYVQDFKTFSVLDGFFDGYVCVSPFVQQFLKQTYGIEAPVIPAFLELDHVPVTPPWLDRPRDQMLVAGKYAFVDLLERFTAIMDSRYPTVDLQINPVAGAMNHRDLLATMGAHRYFLTLTPCEGFGLMPLEAMACGCTVLGFHGNGGTAYMENGHNCAVVGYPNMDALCETVVSVISDEGRGFLLARAGVTTAPKHSYAHFETNWIAYLEGFLDHASEADSRISQPTS
jgi:hypothetical protein